METRALEASLPSRFRSRLFCRPRRPGLCFLASSLARDGGLSPGSQGGRGRRGGARRDPERLVRHAARVPPRPHPAGGLSGRGGEGAGRSREPGAPSPQRRSRMDVRRPHQHRRARHRAGGGARRHHGLPRRGQRRRLQVDQRRAPTGARFSTHVALFSIGALCAGPQQRSRASTSAPARPTPRSTPTTARACYRIDNARRGLELLGLAETRRIARVRVDPSNPSRIFVAAMGPQFSHSARSRPLSQRGRRRRTGPRCCS